MSYLSTKLVPPLVLKQRQSFRCTNLFTYLLCEVKRANAHKHGTQNVVDERLCTQNSVTYDSSTFNGDDKGI